MQLTLDSGNQVWLADSWSDLTINAVSNIYLHGNPNGPITNPVQPRIRTVRVNMQSFMDSGPGRYVRLSDFKISELLISDQATLFTKGYLLPSGQVTKKQLIEEYGYQESWFKFGLTQIYQTPGTSDYSHRAYVYGSTGTC